MAAGHNVIRNNNLSVLWFFFFFTNWNRKVGHFASFNDFTKRFLFSPFSLILSSHGYILLSEGNFPRLDFRVMIAIEKGQYNEGNG